jgi:hypothetical protein
VYDLKHPDRAARKLTGHSSEISAIDFGPQDATVASANFAGEILVHQLAASSMTAKLASDGSPLFDVQHSPHRSGILAACGEAGIVQVWDIPTATQTVLKPGQSLGQGEMRALRFSTTSANLLAAVGGKRLCFFDISSKKCIRDIATDYALTAIDYHSDGCSLALGTSIGHILLYDIRAASKPTAKILNAHQGQVNAVKFQHQVQGKKTSMQQNTTQETGRARADGQQQLNLTQAPPSSSSSNLNTSSSSHQLNSSVASANLSAFTNQTAPAGHNYGSSSSSHQPPPGLGDMFSPLKSQTPLSFLPSPTNHESRTTAAATQREVTQAAGAAGSVAGARGGPPSHLTSHLSFGSGAARNQTQQNQNGGVNFSNAMQEHQSNYSSALQSPPRPSTPSSTSSSFPSSTAPSDSKALIPTTPHRRGASASAQQRAVSPPRAQSPTTPSRVSGPRGDGSLNEYQLSLLKSMLDESLYSLRSEFRSQLQDMHMAMIQQFHASQMEHAAQMGEMQAKFDAMLQEVKILREDYQLRHRY